MQTVHQNFNHSGWYPGLRVLYYWLQCFKISLDTLDSHFLIFPLPVCSTTFILCTGDVVRFLLHIHKSQTMLDSVLLRFSTWRFHNVSAVSLFQCVLSSLPSFFLLVSCADFHLSNRKTLHPFVLLLTCCHSKSLALYFFLDSVLCAWLYFFTDYTLSLALYFVPGSVLFPWLCALSLALYFAPDWLCTLSMALYTVHGSVHCPWLCFSLSVSLQASL
jgi:hypothetical protein